MVKTFKNLLQNRILKLGMQHQGLKLYKVYINDDTGLTLTYFYGKVKLGRLYVLMGKTVTKSFNGENLLQNGLN